MSDLIERMFMSVLSGAWISGATGAIAAQPQPAWMLLTGSGAAIVMFVWSGGKKR